MRDEDKQNGEAERTGHIEGRERVEDLEFECDEAVLNEVRLFLLTSKALG
jgi:hypothetical protein